MKSSGRSRSPHQAPNGEVKITSKWPQLVRWIFVDKSVWIYPRVRMRLIRPARMGCCPTSQIETEPPALRLATKQYNRCSITTQGRRWRGS